MTAPSGKGVLFSVLGLEAGQWLCFEISGAVSQAFLLEGISDPVEEAVKTLVLWVVVVDL